MRVLWLHRAGCKRSMHRGFIVVQSTDSQVCRVFRAQEGALERGNERSDITLAVVKTKKIEIVANTLQQHFMADALFFLHVMQASEKPGALRQAPIRSSLVRREARSVDLPQPQISLPATSKACRLDQQQLQPRQHLHFFYTQTNFSIFEAEVCAATSVFRRMDRDRRYIFPFHVKETRAL